MIKEVIVVEGKSDIAAVRRAVDAEVIETGGFALNAATMEKITAAYNKRGIILLTDPDHAGERIRKKLTKAFPLAAQAFIPLVDATGNGDIGVEQASIEAIRAALGKVRTHVQAKRQEFSLQDLYGCGLAGEGSSAIKRAKLGKILGIGYGNAKQFLSRLNNYGVEKAEFLTALDRLEEG